MLCQPDLNAFRAFFRETQAEFFAQTGIVYPDPRQTCIVDFVLFCLDALKTHGAIDPITPTPDDEAT